MYYIWSAAGVSFKSFLTGNMDIHVYIYTYTYTPFNHLYDNLHNDL